jgi:crotonobetainyl-CoA:carnitine CoA-transferase CaiB-like acyl-CoA transferase
LNQTATALGDVRIRDFSRVLAGPFATMLLAVFGATATTCSTSPSDAIPSGR